MKKTAIFLLITIFSIGIIYAQNEKKPSIPLIGSEAPSFTAETTNGTLNFPYDFGKKWKVLLSHPGDFTPVCTSEIIELAKMQNQLQEMGIEVAVLSTDNKKHHQLWKDSMEEVLSNEPVPVKIKFPLIDDENMVISKLYGMLHSPVSTSRDVRGVFVINPDNIVEATYFYPMSIGRNLNELVRTVQALQTAQASNLFTPVNWEPGKDLLVPHFPYTKEELAKNKDLANEFYNVGSYMWYKKAYKQ
ncbi:MAG: redoxin domain-containing protein [Syntrophomonadaceae bacterium]|nr:redoxin domain-containing protein [Syntrophomonadaceae bacterium]